jgi:hypothetical protein
MSSSSSSPYFGFNRNARNSYYNRHQRAFFDGVRTTSTTRSHTPTNRDVRIAEYYAEYYDSAYIQFANHFIEHSQNISSVYSNIERNIRDISRYHRSRLNDLYQEVPYHSGRENATPNTTSPSENTNPSWSASMMDISNNANGEHANGEHANDEHANGEHANDEHENDIPPSDGENDAIIREINRQLSLLFGGAALQMTNDLQRPTVTNNGLRTRMTTLPSLNLSNLGFTNTERGSTRTTQSNAFSDALRDILLLSATATATATATANLADEPREQPLTESEMETYTRTTRFSNIVTPINTICPISQEVFADDTEVIQLRKCSHNFLPDYIKHWFVQHTTCPMCRSNVRDVPREQENAAETHHETTSTPTHANPSSEISIQSVLSNLIDMSNNFQGLDIHSVNDDHITFSYVCPYPTIGSLIGRSSTQVSREEEEEEEERRHIDDVD